MPVSIRLEEVSVHIQTPPDRTHIDKLIVFVDPQSGLQFHVPLSSEASQDIASQLTDRPTIQIAQPGDLPNNGEPA